MAVPHNQSMPRLCYRVVGAAAGTALAGTFEVAASNGIVFTTEPLSSGVSSDWEVMYAEV